jgi:hypothetical protein
VGHFFFPLVLFFETDAARRQGAMKKAILTVSMAAFSLFTIATWVRAEIIKYKCTEGDTIRVDTKAQTVVVTDVSEDGADFDQPNVQISNAYISFGTDHPIRINRKTGAVENIEKWTMGAR